MPPPSPSAEPGPSAADRALGERLVADGHLTRVQLEVCLRLCARPDPDRNHPSLAAILHRQGFTAAAAAPGVAATAAERAELPTIAERPAAVGPRPPANATTNAAADAGKTIDRYVVIDELGRGGMGVVYRAYDPNLDREVAVKQIRNAAAFGESEALVRFHREAKLVARLRHPAIVSVYEAGEHDGLPFIVMDFVRGRSLSEIFRARSMPPPELARVVATLARALQHAHDHGVIHRAVKPANVLLDEDGEPRLLDFGLSRDQGAGSITSPDLVIGSPNFMAPEQADPSLGPIDPRTDVWALGGVLYHGLCGALPFQGESPAQVIKRVLLDDPVPPAEVAPGVPAGLSAIALRCLEKDAARRYPSAAAVAEDLDAVREGRRPSRSSSSGRVRAQRPGSRSGRRSDRAARADPTDPRGPGAAPILAAVGGGLLILLVAIALLGGGRAETPADRSTDDAPALSTGAPTTRAPAAADDAPTPASIELTIDAPADGAVLSRAFVVHGRAPGASIVEAAGASGPVDADGVFRLEIAVAGGDGERALPLLARAADGGEARRSVTIVIDATPPAIALETPADAGAVVGRSLRVRGRVDDAHPRALRIGPAGAPRTGDAELALSPDGRFDATVSLADGADGERTLVLVALDRAGNASAPLRLLVTCDSTAPRITLELGEAAGPLTVETSFALRGRVDDAHPPPTITVGGETVPLTAGRFEASVALAEGANPIDVAATDAAGNAATVSATIHRDTTPPVITAAVPETVGGPDRSLTVAGAVSEPGCTVRVNGDAATMTGTDFEATVRLKSGRNRIRIAATDPAGHAAEEVTATVTYRRSAAGVSKPPSSAKLPGDLGRVGSSSSDLDVSPDGTLVAVASHDGAVHLLSMIDGAAKGRIQVADRPLYSVAFSPDGKLLVAGGSNGSAGVYRVATGERIFATPTSGSQAMVAIDWSPDGRHLATGDQGPLARVWSATDGTRLLRIDVPKQSYSVSFHPDARRVAIGCHDGAARVIAIDQGGKVLFESREHGKEVREVAWSPDGKLLATGGDDRSVQIVDDDGKTLGAFRPSSLSPVRGLAWSANGRAIAVSDADGRLFLIPVAAPATGVQIGSTGAGAILAVAFSADGRRIVGACIDGTVRSWPVPGR